MDDPDFTQALVFTGGGTGGHLFPAMALAQAAGLRWPDRPIVFVGATRGIEAQRLPDSPWPHVLLDVEGFLGRSPLSIGRAAWKLARARRHLIWRWRSSRPWAVIGTGGYAAAPAILAARALGIPYVLHESNAAPGSLVKLVSRKARRIWCGLEAVAPLLPGADCLVVGTPVRAEFLRAFTPVGTLPAPRTVLVLGGSGGARALNDAMLELAADLLEAHPDWNLVHQTGASDFPRLEQTARHDRHVTVPFIEDPDRAMEASSIVVSRSGASTCAELKACGRPALLVPFPQAAADHQTVNARAMAQEGRAIVLPQGPGLADRLHAELSSVMEDAALRTRLARPEANTAVVRCLDDLLALLGT